MFEKKAKNGNFSPKRGFSRLESLRTKEEMARKNLRCLHAFRQCAVIKRVILITSMPFERALTDASNGVCNIIVSSLQTAQEAVETSV